MDKIAFDVHKYLRLSEPFVYDPLINIKAFTPIVLTEATEHLDKFPFPHLYSISDLPPHQRLLEFLTNNFGKFSFFKKIIQEQNIKLIHAHFAWEGSYMLPLKKHFKIPLITSLYGVDISMYPSNPVYRFMLKRLFQKGDLFLAACEDLKRRAIAIGCPASKIQVQYCGIDLNRFNFVPRQTKKGETVKILMLGRLVEKKGFGYGIRAFAQSYKNNKNIRLRIIGSGPLKLELTKLISTLGLEPVITFEEAKDHQGVAKAMQAADIFLMTYLTARNGDAEGTPSVIKEAQAVGLPVVTTKHAGVPEGVLEGETGFLAAEKDVAGISQKLNQLIENRELRIRFGQRGRKWVEEKFDILRQARQLENIYQQLIRPR
jgi:glycosyltransferase involved in cell wall biosynthesis